MRSILRSITFALVAVLAVASLSGPAGAKGKGKAKGKNKPRPAVTKMVFKLTDHEVAVGDTVTGSLRVLTRSGKRWVPFPGADVAVSLDHQPAGGVTTDGDGRALVEVVAEEAGEHVVKVRFAGDATHKKAQRAQGFEATGTGIGTWYVDADGDGFGDAAQPVEGLEQPAGTVDNDTDCDDANAAVNPDAVEDPANLVDDDCDGEIDEAA